LKKKDTKVGQLVKLSSVRGRWSDFVDTSQLGIVLGQTDQGLVKVLFTDGGLKEHWHFSLEEANETT
jgi:hypothetical protein